MDQLAREQNLIIGINSALSAIVYCLSEAGTLDLERLELAAQQLLAHTPKGEGEWLRSAPLSALIDYARNGRGLVPVGH